MKCGRFTQFLSAFYGLVGIVLVAASWLLAPALLIHVKMSASLHAVAPRLLTLSLGSFVLSVALWAPLGTTLAGLGRLRVAAICNAIGALAFVAAALIVLKFHFGIVGLIVSSYVQVFCSMVCGYVVTTRIVGKRLLVLPWNIDRALLRAVLSFGGWVQIGTIAALVNNETPALMLGLFAGVEYVGLFDIGSRLSKVVKAFAYHFNAALLPTISSLETTAGTGGSTQTLATANRVFGLISFGITGLVIASSSEIIHMWLGNSIKREDLVLLVVFCMSIVYAVEGVSAVVATGLRGAGKPWVETYYAVAYSAVDILLSLFLTPRLGLSGVLIALVAGSLSGDFAFYNCNGEGRRSERE